MKNKRLGKFMVLAKLIDNDLEVMQLIMSKCVIVRSELLYYNNCFEYIAISDEFRELGEIEKIPTYLVVIDNSTGNTAVTFIEEGEIKNDV